MFLLHDVPNIGIVTFNIERWNQCLTRGYTLQPTLGSMSCWHVGCILLSGVHISVYEFKHISELNSTEKIGGKEEILFVQ